jgi:hypothetical protein
LSELAVHGFQIVTFSHQKKQEREDLSGGTSEEGTALAVHGDRGTCTPEKSELVVSRNTDGCFEKQDADFLERAG